jgi:hypothetical protein
VAPRRAAPSGGQALLVVLVGLVGKAADQGQAAELDGAARERPARAGAEDQSAQPAERRAGAELIARDQFLEPRDQLIGRLSRGLADCIACASRGARHFVEPARAFSHPGRRLAKHLPERVEQRPASRSSLAEHAIGRAGLPATEDVAQHVLQAAARAAASPRSPAAAKHAAKQVFQALAAGLRARSARTRFRCPLVGILLVGFLFAVRFLSGPRVAGRWRFVIFGLIGAAPRGWAGWRRTAMCRRRNAVLVASRQLAEQVAENVSTGCGFGPAWGSAAAADQ